MNELNRIIDANENVFWEGKPRFLPFIFGTSLRSIVRGLICIVFLSPVFLRMPPEFDVNILTILPLLILVYFLIFIVRSIFIDPVYYLLAYSRIRYAITNKRILLRKCVTGRDLQTIDLNRITDAKIKVGFFDMLFGGRSGSLVISTAGAGSRRKRQLAPKAYKLQNIEDPHTVFKLFQRITDGAGRNTQYPNEERPETNTGYDTGYEPK